MGLKRQRRTSTDPDYDLGVVSDTHGLIRPETLKALRGANLIIHCGDIGDPSVLKTLRTIASVRAIRGNNDHGAWANRLPEHDFVRIGSQTVYVLHNLAELELNLEASAVTTVLSGHSHKPVAEWRGGILYLNPGSAGPRRFKLPVTVARLSLRSGRWKPRIVRLV
jgi:putative phosphoesterase